MTSINQGAREQSRLPEHMTLLLLCLAGLWLFMLQGRVLSTGWIMAVWAAATLVMLRGLFHRARVRRRAWRSAYLYPESPWNRRLRGGWLLMGVQFLKAAGLSAILLLTVVRVGAEPAFWRLMLVAILVLLLARMVTDRLFRHEASAIYRPELVARVGQWVTGLLMVLCLLLWAFIQPQPDLRDATLEQALWHATDQEVAASELVQRGARALAAWQGAEQWVAQMLTTMESSWWFRLGVWVSFLLRQSLFVVSFLVLLNGVLAGRLHDGER